jgi:hypothetical protein
MKKPLQTSLSAPSLIQSVFELFRKVPDPREVNLRRKITFSDCLMSGLAIFSLKFPSLLQYDRSRKDPEIKRNLKELYHVETPPSDTYFRERLDEVDPSYVRKAFKKIFSILQRGKALEQYQFLSGHYLLSIDGTGSFSSSKISCEHCCRKESKSGEVSYYHQMLGACIVHPKKSNVIPLCPEVIQNQDGASKNDCERNASRRFIENFRREHPHLKVIIIEDGLASNAPHLRMLEDNHMKYIIGAKEGDHQYLFKEVNNSTEVKYYEVRDKDGIQHQFQYLNDVSLNKSNKNLKVNFLEYRQTNLKGKELNFSWVTNIQITTTNIFSIMEGGRARWKVENEMFNTLKNLGNNFEHNYGHGKQYLSTILCLLMILAFLIDQVQELCCPVFKALRKKAGSYRSLWERMRVIFEYVYLESWIDFYSKLLKKSIPNTS